MYLLKLVLLFYFIDLQLAKSARYWLCSQDIAWLNTINYDGCIVTLPSPSTVVYAAHHGSERGIPLITLITTVASLHGPLRRL